MPQAGKPRWRDATQVVGGMSGKVQPMAIAARQALPLAHLEFALSGSTCGHVMWALRFVPPVGMDARPALVANGFCDAPSERLALAAELRALAIVLEDWR